MIAPLSLANVLTVLIAAICLKMVASQTAGRVLKLPRLALPAALATVDALVLLAGVFDANLTNDAVWVGAAVVGFAVGRMRGLMLPMQVFPGKGAVRATQTADNLAAAFALLALAMTDFTSAALGDPLIEPAQVAAGAALCAGFLVGRWFAMAVRADRMAES
ncbi:MAG: hypothetical protein ISP45_28225 [Reyranella sp.]|nr:hypothetical protein [Reyranella sp.]